jgi:hypothetical protein
MKEQKKIVLMKNLPNCPKGRVFKEDINGDFYHSMTDDEAIEGKLKSCEPPTHAIGDELGFLGLPKNFRRFTDCAKRAWTYFISTSVIDSSCRYNFISFDKDIFCCI